MFDQSDLVSLTNFQNPVEIDKFDFTGGSKAAQAMTAGAIDISLSGGPDMAFIAKGAPELAVPRVLIAVEEIPLLGTGKTDYVRLGAMAAEKAADMITGRTLRE